MAKRAIENESDLVLVAGGDGTVRVVCAALAHTGIPVGVIPAGTGNLLARNLHIPLDLDDALERILDGRDRRIDLVKVYGDGLDTDRFAVMAGLGLDAAIISGAPPDPEGADRLDGVPGLGRARTSTTRRCRSASPWTTTSRSNAASGPW